MIKINAPLRGYQERVNLDTRKALKDHKRVITQMATGSGKTRVFIDVADSARKKGNKVIIVIRRRSLIFQTRDAYIKFTGFTPSIVMASERGFDDKNPVQIVSIDTINRRMNRKEYQFLLDFNILIVDECHDSTSPKYKSFLHLFPNKFWLGYTATALPTGTKYLTDWEDIIFGPTPAQLRDMGFLAPERTYAPKKINVKGIKTIAGEYDQKALAERVMESKIVGDSVDVYKKFGENRIFLGYAVNIEHSKMLAEAFRQNGIPAIHIDQSHSQEEREAAIQSLYNGTNRGLFSVGVFSTGTDVPIAGTLINARPTKSEILYVQITGRILRPYKQCSNCNNHLGAENQCFRCGSTHFKNVKKDAIILDQANNCERFGLAYDKRYAKIRPPDGKKKKDLDPELEIKTKTCEECYAVYSIDNSVCPLCGHQNAKTEREIKQEQGELRRVKSKELRYSRMIEIKNDLMKLSNPQWKESAKWIRLYKIYGKEIFDFKDELEIPRWVKSQITKLKVRQNSINT